MRRVRTLHPCSLLHYEQACFHDETTCCCTDFHTKQTWVRLGDPLTSTKCSPGPTIMCTGWLSPIGYLYGALFDVHAEGSYWTNEHMVKHTEQMLDAVSPQFTAVDFWFMLDNRCGT